MQFRGDRDIMLCSYRPVKSSKHINVRCSKGVIKKCR